MELSYGVPFGKKSKTVTRAGEDVDENDLESEDDEEYSKPIQNDHSAGTYQYPACVVGHASRSTPTMESERHIRNMSHQKRKGLDVYCNEISNTGTLSCDDLPHPNKLRKHTHRKPTKIRRNLEKQMCVDNHLRQLQQRNYKYQLCKNEEVIPESLKVETEPAMQNYETEKSQTPKECEIPDSSRKQNEYDSRFTLQTSLNCLPLLNLPHFKKHVKPKQMLFPPGSVLLGSASLEQEEEDKWFHQLWKPRKTSRSMEE